jgi:HlyD family secretion protein
LPDGEIADERPGPAFRIFLWCFRPLSALLRAQKGVKKNINRPGGKVCERRVGLIVGEGLDARIAAAREKIEVARRALDDSFLRAPSDGTVLEILKREGDGTRVLDGQPAIIFADVSRLRIRAEIDERHVHLLSRSMPAVVTRRALGFREFHGKVVRVNQIMRPKTVFARVADERRDLDVVQVLIDMGPDFQFPVGLRVDVYLERTPLRVDSGLDRSEKQSKKLIDHTSAKGEATPSANPHVRCQANLTPAARESAVMAGSGPHHRHLARRDFREDCFVDLQVCPHEFVGRERQPLRERDIFKSGAPEHLEKP